MAADRSTTLFSASDTRASNRADRVSSFKTNVEKRLSNLIISGLWLVLLWLNQCDLKSLSRQEWGNFVLFSD